MGQGAYFEFWNVRSMALGPTAAPTQLHWDLPAQLLRTIVPASPSFIASAFCVQKLVASASLAGLLHL